jgi:hypothetical protein
MIRIDVWEMELVGEYLDGRFYDSKNEPMNKWKIEIIVYELYVP